MTTKFNNKNEKNKIFITIAIIVLILMAVVFYLIIGRNRIFCPESIHSIGFAVDKDTVIFVPWEHPDKITKLDLRNGNRTKLADTPVGIDDALQVSDTKFLLFGEDSTYTYIYNYKTNKIKQIANIDHHNALPLTSIRLGGKFYIISYNTFVSYNIKTDEVKVLKSHICSNNSLDILSDGKILISCDAHKDKRIINTCEDPYLWSRSKNSICNPDNIDKDKEPYDLTIYDPITNKFETLSNNFHVSKTHKLLSNDKILYCDSGLKLYNLKTKTFEPVKELYEDINDYSTTNSNKINKKGEIVLLGCNIYRYKPETNSFNPLFEGNCSRTQLLNNGNILLFDTGYGSISSYPSKNILFDIKNNQLYSVSEASRQSSIENPQSILLKDDRILFYYGKMLSNRKPPLVIISPCSYNSQQFSDANVEIYTPN